MPRLLLAATVLVAALLPATAQAQAPPDDAAAAAAYGAATERLAATVATLGPAVKAGVEAENVRSCRGVWREVPRRRQFAAEVLGLQAIYRVSLGPAAVALRTFSGELHAVTPADPGLRSARAVWRQKIRRYAALSASEPLCARLRRWEAEGFPARPDDVRLALRLFRAEDRRVEAYERILGRAARRLRELGVERRVARRFAGGEVLLEPLFEALDGTDFELD